jgi:Mg-chelatase subunit ChlD
MAGERLATASLAVAACALRAREEYAVLAFARWVTVVRDLRDSPRTEDVVDATLALRGHGLTGLAGALERAAETVGRSRASRRVVVLLSDCRATDGVDPVPAAMGLTDLLVVAPAADAEDAIELAAAANAQLTLVGRPSDVVEALNEQLRTG